MENHLFKETLDLTIYGGDSSQVSLRVPRATPGHNMSQLFFSHTCHVTDWRLRCGGDGKVIGFNFDDETQFFVIKTLTGFKVIETLKNSHQSCLTRLSHPTRVVFLVF